MKPASTTSSDPTLVEPVAERRGRARRGPGGRRSRRPPSPRPRAAARSSPRPRPGSTRRPRSRLPSRPCTVSSSAWRFVPSPEIEDRDAGSSRARRAAPGRARRSSRAGPRSISSSTRARMSARRMCEEHAVGGKPVVGVALDLLAARAVQDLRAGGAARRPGRAAAATDDDRVVEALDLHRIGRRRDEPQRRVAGVAAARRRRGGPERSPKCRRIASRRQRVLLDVRPDLAVLAPARAGGLLDRGAAERRGAAVEAAEHRVRRRGRAPTARARSPARA